MALSLLDYSLRITEVFLQQILWWETQSPVQSPMGFVCSFVQHFPQTENHRGPCDCHSESFTNLQLPFHGTIREHTAANPDDNHRKEPIFRVHRESDNNRFRQFTSEGGPPFNDGDLAFALGFQVWSFVVRPRADHGRQNALIQKTKEIIGIIYHYGKGTHRNIPVDILDGFAKDSKTHLKEQENVLIVPMKVEQLIKLARFMESPFSVKWVVRY